MPLIEEIAPTIIVGRDHAVLCRIAVTLYGPYMRKSGQAIQLRAWCRRRSVPEFGIPARRDRYEEVSKIPPRRRPCPFVNAVLETYLNIGKSSLLVHSSEVAEILSRLPPRHLRWLPLVHGS